MPPVSACGRFDNAPAHIIIESTLHRRGPAITEDPPQLKAAKRVVSAVKELERKKLATKKRIAKMVATRKRALEARRASMDDWLPGETKDQRVSRRSLARRLTAEELQLAALPAGYALVRAMELPVCVGVVHRYLRHGAVHGVKIGVAWYANRDEILAAATAAHERHLASLRQNATARKLAWKRRNDEN